MTQQSTYPHAPQHHRHLPHRGDFDESYVDCQTHAAREAFGVLSGKGPSTEIKDPWLLAEVQDKGGGGV